MIFSFCIAPISTTSPIFVTLLEMHFQDVRVIENNGNFCRVGRKEYPSCILIVPVKTEEYTAGGPCGAYIE